jgi:aspartate/methionine/tyrosine aminotransferase
MPANFYRYLNMQHTIIQPAIIENLASELAIRELGLATIREIVTIVNRTEALTGTKFVRMEMGIPSLPPPAIGTEAEIAALRSGVASKYPMLEGLPALKEEASRFFNAFLNISVSASHIIPVVGSMQGTFTSFLTIAQARPDRPNVLFIDPGFPVQKQQLAVLGIGWKNFDIYDYRGSALEEKLDELLAGGDISCIIYSNPNNPSWICFTEEELSIIGRMADKHDVIIIEDLAYFGMDFRKDLGNPFEPPFQSTVARYTDNYILQLSSSKVFSYAGQRIGLTAISDKLYDRGYPALMNRYGVASLGAVYVTRVLYALSSGTSHSAQYALAAMLKAANDGEFRFIDEVSEYGRRASIMKALFLENGFHLVYDRDLDAPLADGFYFTVGYSNMSGAELSHKLLYYGISAISLDNTGSKQQGIRACTAFVTSDQFGDLENRLKAFDNDFGKN